jgi:hypothetical protein
MQRGGLNRLIPWRTNRMKIYPDGTATVGAILFPIAMIFQKNISKEIELRFPRDIDFGRVSAEKVEVA